MIHTIKIIPTPTSFVRRERGKLVGQGEILVNSKRLDWHLDENRDDFKYRNVPLSMTLSQGYSIWNKSGLSPAIELEVRKFIFQEIKKGNIRKGKEFGGVF